MASRSRPGRALVALSIVLVLAATALLVRGLLADEPLGWVIVAALAGVASAASLAASLRLW